MHTATGAPVRERINGFLANPVYIMLIMLLTAISFAFGGELVLYTVFTAFIIYICVFGNDLLPIMPILVCAYVAPSIANNPGQCEASVFFGSSGVYILCLAGLIFAALAYRVIRDRKQFLTQKRKLLSGMLVLTAAYLLSGIGSAGYSHLAGKNILFALLQGLSILLPYWLLTGGVDWKNTRRDYLAWVGFGTGCLLLWEILWIYCKDNIIVDGIIDRTRIYTGWGMYNNMGCLLAMMIPFAFALASKYRKGWIGTVAGSSFLMGVFLTCSRTSIVVAVVCYIICVCLMLFYATNRKGNAVALLIVGSILILSLLLFHNRIIRLFSQVLDDISEFDSRIYIYVRGWEQFIQNPVFGISFYPAEGLAWGWSTTQFAAFFPDRWHNTVIQLLASTGVVGFGAYLFHRYQTLRMVLKSNTRAQLLMACSVLVLLLCSMLDCHFFNIGPTLFYSMILAFGEKRGAPNS